MYSKRNVFTVGLKFECERQFVWAVWNSETKKQRLADINNSVDK